MVTPSWVRNHRYNIIRSPSGRRTIVPKSPGPKIIIPASSREAVNTFLRRYFTKSTLSRRKNVNFPYKLGCESKDKFFQNSTNNGRAGPQLKNLNMTSTRLRTIYNSRLGRKKIRPGFAKIGSGKQGVVFLACTTRDCHQKVIIKVSPSDRVAETRSHKQPAEIEYDIQKAIFKVVPRHVAVPYNIIHCRDFVPIGSFLTVNRTRNFHDQIVTFSEYCPGGDLDAWLVKVRTRITDRDMSHIIFQIIQSLKKIHTKYPEFRHNDLYLKNVLVDDRGKHPRMVISDFGLARLKARGSNPVVNSNEFRSYGITSSTDARYDSHLFLNALRIHLSQGGYSHLIETRHFLDRVVPPGYRGRSDRYIHESRLVGTRFPGLPTFDQILNDSFLSHASVRLSNTRSVSSPRVRENIPFTPVSTRNAADIARNALGNIARVTTETRPSASNFLRMSPRSRAALLSRPRGNRPVRRLNVPVTSRRTTTAAPMYFARAIPPPPPPARRSPSAPAPAPAVRARVNANAALKYYMNTHNARVTTKRNLKRYLTNQRGYSPASAKREVNRWVPLWTASRRNLAEATRLAELGVNVNARGYAKNIANIAKRRAQFKLKKSPGGRIRKNKKLLTTLKKDQLVQMARNAGTKTSGTKQEIINALYG